MRLRRAVVTTALALPLLLAACGSDDPEPAATGGGETDAGAGVFPVTVTHKYGETVVPEEPERVVSVGVTEQDVLLELGVVPVLSLIHI